MGRSITDISRDCFHQVVLPILQREMPEIAAQGAFGLFGYGSEALGLDDEYSRDHHFGLRIDALLPEELFRTHGATLQATVAAHLPATFEGVPLREGHHAGAGLALDSREGFLKRTIGLTHAPTTDPEWLQIPEEDIVHVVNGQLWHDPSGGFAAVRAAFANHYPESVRRRRIAHWCRYFSGMGTYALKRALLRGNDFYATTRFAAALRWGIQLAFLLDRRYAPYDKWLMAHFAHLPRLAAPLRPLVDEAVLPATPWERKLELLDAMADVLDQTLVDDGIIAPHPTFAPSPTSGYRLLEHAYAEILRGLPEELAAIVPVWDQVHLESFHAGYVRGLTQAHWDGLLGLRVDGD